MIVSSPILNKIDGTWNVELIAHTSSDTVNVIICDSFIQQYYDVTSDRIILHISDEKLPQSVRINFRSYPAGYISGNYDVSNYQYTWNAHKEEIPSVYECLHGDIDKTLYPVLNAMVQQFNRSRPSLYLQIEEVACSK